MVERVLDTIIAHKRVELAATAPTRRRRTRAQYSLHAALAQRGTRFIYEFKRASPSAGVLRVIDSLDDVAQAYAGIADAVSVLTDERFFGGSLADLSFVGDRLKVPVLRKDFIIDPVQVYDAWAYGADAVLLMLSVLDDAVYRDCAAEAARHGLEVLTEVHDEGELERALALDAMIIGVNNRSFADLSIDLTTTTRLAPLIPDGRLCVAESGITDRATVQRLAPDVDAFLVGSALMRSPRIDLAARQLAFGEVKVCGLTRPADAADAWHAGASWGGVVFAESPRQVDVHQARAIASASPLPLVGVFVDATPEQVGALARAVPLAAVQLHGNEDDRIVAATRAALPDDCALWRAYRVGDALPPTQRGVDRVLYDCTAPGSGTRFDWSLLDAAPPGFGLAGGITADTVAAALATGAALLDVSSGVETAPGLKSATRLHEFFTEIRNA
ncbi:MAG: bifunctional indole-3-glycerol-phosphate synthase TrpC/phosphoribosylanthranilate isomerase TrpF [Gammaproteobacteria bacterium]